MPKQNITIGCDPEVFVQTKKGTVIPAVGLIGGTKEKPIKVMSGALQEDNVLGEFNTDPATSYINFRDNIRTVMGILESKVHPHKLKILSSHRFSASDLQAAGDQALEFGCNPDINAWTGAENDAPSPYTTLRTAGGHVHLGFDVKEDDLKSRYDVIKLMDVYLGIPSVLLDGDTDRRGMYGQAGACRTKIYGVEYRVLSNFWLQSDKHIEWVYNQATRAVENKEYVNEILDKYSPELIQKTINESDIEQAALIVNDLQLDLVEG